MKRKISIIIGTTLLLMVMVACGKGDVTEIDEEVISNAEDDIAEKGTNYDKVFEDADRVAAEVLEAYINKDYDLMISHSSPVGREAIDDDSNSSSYGFKKGEISYPDHFDNLGEYYSIKRYDDYYDENEGIIWYGIDYFNNIKLEENGKLNDEKVYEILNSTSQGVKLSGVFFPMKQNPEGEWKIGEIKHDPDEGIDKENATIVKEFPVIEEKEEDKFGF